MPCQSPLLSIIPGDESPAPDRGRARMTFDHGTRSIGATGAAGWRIRLCVTLLALPLGALAAADTGIPASASATNPADVTTTPATAGDEGKCPRKGDCAACHEHPGHVNSHEHAPVPGADQHSGKCPHASKDGHGHHHGHGTCACCGKCAAHALAPKGESSAQCKCRHGDEHGHHHPQAHGEASAALGGAAAGTLGHEPRTLTVQPKSPAHAAPHPDSIPPSPPVSRLLLDAYADGSWAERVLTLHQAMGADLRAHDETGQTLLMKAAARDDLALVQALMAANVPLDSTDIHGWSALEHAVQGQATTAALALIAGGARERIDHHENSTLQYAVNLVADSQVIAALVRAGADVNRRSLDGLTVLMEAIDAGNPVASIEALFAVPGLDLTLRDPRGEDALTHARAGADPAVVALIESRLGNTVAPEH